MGESPKTRDTHMKGSPNHTISRFHTGGGKDAYSSFAIDLAYPFVCPVAAFLVFHLPFRVNLLGLRGPRSWLLGLQCTRFSLLGWFKVTLSVPLKSANQGVAFLPMEIRWAEKPHFALQTDTPIPAKARGQPTVKRARSGTTPSHECFSPIACTAEKGRFTRSWALRG